jgi:hypothetical protein
MVASRGSHVDLYGEVLRLQPKRVVICEGEFDRLVLEANGFEAVTSTGGAATFRAEWADAFDEIPKCISVSTGTQLVTKAHCRRAGWYRTPTCSSVV